MTKILLISPGHEDKSEEFNHNRSKHRTVHRDSAPLALLNVATHLIDHGYDPEILDTHIIDDYEGVISERIRNGDYLFVGMTVIIGSFQKNAAELTRLVQKLSPGTPIVWGGIMALIYPEECIRTYGPDFIVRFEGEDTVLELARALENGEGFEHIDGLTFKNGDLIVSNGPRKPKQNLDEFSIPQWELLGQNFNWEQVPYFQFIMSSKGCPFDCTFCYKHSVDLGIRDDFPPWRARSADHVIREVEYVHDKTGARVFTFMDDNFLTQKKRSKKILEYFKDKGFYVEDLGSHFNNMSVDVLDAMTGVVQTAGFSVESASPRLLKLLRKQLNLERVPAKVKQLYERGVACPTNFMIGIPGETDEDLRQNVELMILLKDVHPFVRATCYMYLPFPETALFGITERICGVELPNRIDQFEDANIYVYDTKDPVGRKFRPWLSQEQFEFLFHFGMIFNDVFQTLNLELKEETRDLLKDSPRLRKLFRGIENVNRPKTLYRPYVLDKVLAGEQIDLANALKGK